MNPSTDPAQVPAPPGATATPPRADSTMHVPGVFSPVTFALVAAGMLAAPVVAALGQVLLADRAGLPPGTAIGLAALAGALVATAGGFVGGAAGRRLAFYETGAASFLLGALLLGPVQLLLVPRLVGSGLAVAAWAAQGRLVLVLGLLLTGVLAGVFASIGSSLGFLLLGSGRFDPSLSYELFVCKSHLRLTPRTLLGLFLLVVTGIAPGLVVAYVASLLRDVEERDALRRGALYYRPRLPATLLMTLISIAGVAMGVWALTVVLSVMSGFEGDLKAKILGTNAHGVVMKYGQNDFTEWRRVRDEALAVRGVAGATPFLYNEVMLSAGQNVGGAVVKGIDPRTVGTVTNLPHDVLPGMGSLELLDHPDRIPPPEASDVFDEAPAAPGGATAHDRTARDREQPRRPAGAPPASAGTAAPAKVLPGIAIGREMARTLSVGLGDVVNVISPLGDLGPAGPQPKSRAFRVGAILYTGMYEYDSKFAYIQLGEAQRFFGTGDTVTGLELKVSEVDEAPAIMKRVLGRLEGYPYRVRDWGQLNRNLFSALMMEKVVMAVILAFIVAVASCTIVATLIMQVLDKRREIAVLKSMGAGEPSVMKIFVAEGVTIGFIGTAFGLLLGLGSCLLIDKVGIPLDPDVYYISNLPVRMNPVEFALVALLALLLSYLATLYPARKASRLEPVDGLRSE